MKPLLVLQAARKEVLGLGLLAIAAAGILIFIKLAEEIGENQYLGFDRRLILAFRTGDTHEPIGPTWVQIMFTDITSLGSTTVLTLVTLAVLGHLLIMRRTGTAILLLSAVAGGTLLNNLMKLVFERPRPDLVAHIVETQTSSFPSGHAMISAITYLTIGALMARVQETRTARIYIIALAVGATVMIGTSRVYLGVHWPSDVLAGWCAGASWAVLCWLLALYLQRRRALPPPQDEAADAS